MTKQLDIWKSSIGDTWTDDANPDPAVRIEAFRTMIGDLDVRRILEVGCNKGFNLQTLSLINNYDLFGVEPNIYAITESCFKYILPRGFAITLGDCFNVGYPDKSFNLVFTCGVLMHVSSEDLPRAVAEMTRVSNKYILVIEYYSEEEQEIEWHGMKNILWKRDYSKVFPNMIKGGFLGREAGFDNCNWWLFEVGKEGEEEGE